MSNLPADATVIWKHPKTGAGSDGWAGRRKTFRHLLFRTSYFLRRSAGKSLSCCPGSTECIADAWLIIKKKDSKHLYLCVPCTDAFSFSIVRNYLITQHCISLISAYSYLFKIFFHFSIDISCFICYIEYNK